MVCIKVKVKDVSIYKEGKHVDVRKSEEACYYEGFVDKIEDDVLTIIVAMPSKNILLNDILICPKTYEKSEIIESFEK